MNSYPLNAADVAGLREVRMDGDAGLVATAAGAVLVGKTVSGAAASNFGGALEMRLGKRLIGTAPLTTAGSLNLRIGVRMAASAPLVASSSLELARGLRSSGSAPLILASQANGYTGGVVRIGAQAAYLVHARGALIARRYAYLSGEASLTLALVQAGRGQPDADALWREAPSARRFIVTPDPRELRVPQAMRSL